MSILNDQQNDNLIKEENNDIKAKNEELEKIKKEIEEKTKYLNELNEEINKKEEQKKMIIDTLNEDLSKIQEELVTKQAEFITFNSDIENSKNIKDINDKYTEEKNKNIELNELYNKLIKEKNDLVKKLETNKNIIEAKNIILRKNNDEIEQLEKDNKMLNEIISQLKIEIGIIKDNLNKYRENIIKLKKQIEEIIKENKNEISNNKNSNELEQKKIITLNIHSDNRDILGSPIKENSNNNNLIINNNKIYSYQCTNLEKLVIDIIEKTDKAEIKIKLKNNGNIPWDKDTKLKMVELSDIKIGDIILKPQNPNTEETYIITFNQLQNYEIKEYKTNLVFCSGGKTYGEKIVIKINILSEIDFCIKKIDEFKKCYDSIECELDDEKILGCLAENNFSFENTFSSLFC